MTPLVGKLFPPTMMICDPMVAGRGRSTNSSSPHQPPPLPARARPASTATWPAPKPLVMTWSARVGGPKLVNVGQLATRFPPRARGRHGTFANAVKDSWVPPARAWAARKPKSGNVTGLAPSRARRVKALTGAFGMG